ncbi:BnaA02g16160D [Brassica napus]|uniref:BnaA02g16160D protein n=1 Tax=Brassica napus TaxID=3708 RepID=A0A078IFW5_BRANA|nr:BnaA02g16160D [Brassica napus]
MDVGVTVFQRRLCARLSGPVTEHVDLLISVKGKRDHVKNSLKAKAEIRSSEDESSSNEDSEEKTVASVKVAAKVSSSSESDDDSLSDDEESDKGEKVGQRMAKADIKIGVVSYSGRWPFGGLGLCGRC